MSAHRCELCGESLHGVGWCKGCRASYHAQNICRANVMTVAAWGAERARAGAKKMARFERALAHVVDTMRKERA